MDKDIFTSGLDDFTFPVTRKGMRQTGMVFESAAEPEKEAPVLESAIDAGADQSVRAKGISSVLSWVDAGAFTYNDLDETIIAVADLDGDYDLSEDEEAEYNDIWREAVNALVFLGADVGDVQEFANGPDARADKAAARIGAALAEIMDKTEADDDALIAGFALGEEAVMENAVFESADYGDNLPGVFEGLFKRMKAVRDGVVQFVKKRVSGKARLSAAMKAALKKARRKAHSAMANLKRRKAMKIRKQRGM